MRTLDPELQGLQERVAHANIVPDTTVTISERIRPTGFLDPIAQITEVAEGATPGDDHYFRLGVPDRPTVEGAIEVDRTGHGYPVLRILASGIFEDDPGVLGTAIGIGLAESGVPKAVVKARFTNLSPDFLEEAGGRSVQVHASEGSDGQLVVFETTLGDHLS